MRHCRSMRPFSNFNETIYKVFVWEIIFSPEHNFANDFFWCILIEFKTWNLEQDMALRNEHPHFFQTPQSTCNVFLLNPRNFHLHRHRTLSLCFFWTMTVTWQNQRAGQMYSRTCLKAFPTWQPHPGASLISWEGRILSIPTATTWKRKKPWNL